MAGDSAPAQTILVQPISVAVRQSSDVVAIEDRHVAAALRIVREHACAGLDVEALLTAVPLSRSVLERRFAQGGNPARATGPGVPLTDRIRFVAG